MVDENLFVFLTLLFKKRSKEKNWTSCNERHMNSIRSSYQSIPHFKRKTKNWNTPIGSASFRSYTPSKIYQKFDFTAKLHRILNTLLYHSILLFMRKTSMLTTPSNNAPSSSNGPSKFYQINQKVFIWEFFYHT